MDPRTFEGPMEWEYQNKGPVDPTSPFTTLAAQGGGLQNGFASPTKGSASSRPNPFATPSKTQQPRPLFTPQSTTTKPSAAPFRNPAFTTPRKPFDELVLSEASGAEDSPAQTEASDVPNDTPEADRMSDVNMTAPISPTRISKSSRYPNRGPSSRKHMPGRGEIRPHRDLGGKELVRRKKPQDRELNNYMRRQSQESDDDSDASFTTHNRYHSRRSASKKAAGYGGVVGSLFHMMEEHRTAPENIHRWIQLSINFFLGLVFCVSIMSVVHTVRSDIRTVNEAARRDIRIKMAECQDQYTANGCATTDAPAFKKMCSEWYDCMMQDPESIVQVKATMTEVANIMNDFFGNLNLKAWGAFFAFLAVMILANNTMLGRTQPSAPSQATSERPPGPSQVPSMPHQNSENIMWIPVQTPRRQRHGLLDDETDTDGSATKSQQFLPPYNPAGRRSPSKRERSLSPLKVARSPTKQS